MSSDQLLVSILSYLSGPFKAAASDAESVDVAVQCLTDAAGIDEQKKTSLAVPHSLPAIFAAGLAALNNQSSTSTKSSTSTSSSTSINDPRYEQFLQLLGSRGFFGNATPGSAEYNEKLELAKKKFVAKYGTGGESSEVKTSTSTSTSASTSTPTSTPYIPTPVTDAQKAKAEDYKAAGNAALAAQKYDVAIESYSAAIASNPNNAIYWANRAAAHQHLRQYEKAVADCREAIRVDPSYAKGHYRLGAALFQLDCTQEAIAAYEKALSLSTSDPNMAANIREQLDVARAKLNPPNPFTGGGGGGFDFASLMNNPAISNLMSQMGGSGGSGGGGLDFGALMSNPAIQQMAQQFMGGMGGNAAASSTSSSASASTSSSTSSSSSSSSSSSGANSDMFNNLMSNPAILALKDDPVLAPVFADVQANGESALFKYMSDPAVMAKLSGVMGSLFGGQK